MITRGITERSHMMTEGHNHKGQAMVVTPVYGRQHLLPSTLARNFKLFACTSHTRFGKLMSSFNVISDRALLLDSSLSWLAFLPNNATLWWL